MIKKTSEATPLVHFWQTADGQVRDAQARLFDSSSHAWITTARGKVAASDDRSNTLNAAQAVQLLTANGARRLPVGVIGPNDASVQELAFAEAVGRAIAGLGLPMICGGRGGCMEAASRGHAEAGGLVIGILPGADWRGANAHVAIPIATGIGEARNAIIASASFALIAVGGGNGTLSEMALGLKMERLVIAMPQAASVSGALRCETVDAAMEAIAMRYLALGELAPAP
ncbi:MAG: DNA-binding protein [Bosea sp. (in: a-proteobacteria)]